MVLFLTGANAGLVNIGTLIGAHIGGLRYRWVLIPLGMVFGFTVAVMVLTPLGMVLWMRRRAMW